jgi:plastocyanin
VALSAPRLAQPGAEQAVSTTTWTLGETVGPQTATAELDRATGSPVTFAAVATLGGDGAEVTVGDNFFTPAEVTVDAGETVTWTWGSGATSQSVCSTGSPSFTSREVLAGSGSTHSFQFDTPGTYTYDCAVHGSAMTGTVMVQ